jgi:hypothetical protein
MNSAFQPYSDLHLQFALLKKYLASCPPVPDELGEAIPRALMHIHGIRQWARKPNVVLSGAYDAGKTHVANTLLGLKILPEDFTPWTRAITIVRHKNDRPSNIEHDVLILDPSFDLQQASDQEHCLEHTIAAGGLDLLNDFATHGSTEGGDAAYAAMVFAETPILDVCNVIDFPGFDDTEEDNRRASEACKVVDVVVYLSMAKGFLRQQDALRLSRLINALPPLEVLDPNFPTLGNLFILASQADPSIAPASLTRILDIGADRLYRFLLDSVWEERVKCCGREITPETLRGRMFPFWSDIAERREGLERNLGEILCEQFPPLFRRQFKHSVEELKNSGDEACARLIETYHNVLRRIEENSRSLVECQGRQEQFFTEAAGRKQEVLRLIREQRARSRHFVRYELALELSKERIEELIRREFREKDDAKSYAAVKVLDRVEYLLKKHLQAASESIKAAADDYVRYFDAQSVTLSFDDVGVKKSIPFDARAAFAGGLAGLSTLGALGLWASALGNLGGYILVAKGVSLMSAIGLATGGTASVISAIAMIGGPLTLAVGLAVAAALAFGWIFGESWQSRLAQGLADSFAQRGFIEALVEACDLYWRQTGEAFEAASVAVDRSYQKYVCHVDKLLREASEASTTRIEELLRQLDELRDFFAAIPLPFGGCLAGESIKGLTNARGNQLH